MSVLIVELVFVVEVYVDGFRCVGGGKGDRDVTRRC